MEVRKTKEVAIIVAHPDDETLWAGGILLAHPEWKCFILCLCRKYDSDRAPKFHNALTVFHAEGIMGDLDDDPKQIPLKKKEIEKLILKLLPKTRYDLIITHNPLGEYTRHIRHEEIGSVVWFMWREGRLTSEVLFLFAYEDGNKKYFPKAQNMADINIRLPKKLWKVKYDIITKIYAFSSNSWEANTTPKTEGFWKFTKKKKITERIKKN